MVYTKSYDNQISKKKITQFSLVKFLNNKKYRHNTIKCSSIFHLLNSA